MIRFPASLLLLTITPAAAHATCWLTDAAGSDVVFSATQAGAPIEGRFRDFTGRICLDDAQPANGAVEVTINTASVDMGIPEFDAEMRGPDFFATERWPHARFTSASVKSIGNGQYMVAGVFTIRDRTRKVEVPFTLESGNTITGETQIRRLDYDIGLGQWTDTRWVGEDVTLKFRVALKAEGVGAPAPTP